MKGIGQENTRRKSEKDDVFNSINIASGGVLYG